MLDPRRGRGLAAKLAVGVAKAMEAAAVAAAARHYISISGSVLLGYSSVRDWPGWERLFSNVRPQSGSILVCTRTCPTTERVVKSLKLPSDPAVFGYGPHVSGIEHIADLLRPLNTSATRCGNDYFQVPDHRTGHFLCAFVLKTRNFVLRALQ